MTSISDLEKYQIDEASVTLGEEVERLRNSPIESSPLWKILKSPLRIDELEELNRLYGYQLLSHPSLLHIYVQSFKKTDTKDQFAMFLRQLHLRESESYYMEGVIVSYLFLLRHRKELDFPSFIFLTLSMERSKESHIATIFRGLMLSRLYFLLRGRHLPILIPILLSEVNHATVALYLPIDKDNEQTVFYRVFIDTSATKVRHDFLQFDLADDAAASLFTQIVSKYQTKSEYSFVKVPCMQNIQKQHGTCALWAFAISLLFLKKWDSIVEIGYPSSQIEHWCTQMKFVTMTKMDKYLEILKDIQNLMRSYFFVIGDQIVFSEVSKPWRKFFEYIMTTETPHLVRITQTLVDLASQEMNQLFPITK